MRYAVLMKRTTIMLPDELDARVRLEARRRGVSIADVARDALEQHVSASATPGRLGFFAIGEGEPSDVSQHVEEYVNGAIDRRNPTGRRTR